MILRIKHLPVPDAILSQTVLLLDRGGILAYPTETVYGLGCDAFQADAVRKVFELKVRERDKPFILLVRSAEAVSGIARGVSPRAERLMEAFWPGPLTLVFESASGLPAHLKSRWGRVGVRVSPDPVCRSILERFRKPIVSTSANPAGKDPARDAETVLDYFGERVDLVLDHGERTSAVPSTVLDVTEDVPVVLRKGSLSIESIRHAIGDILEKASV